MKFRDYLIEKYLSEEAKEPYTVKELEQLKKETEEKYKKDGKLIWKQKLRAIERNLKIAKK